MAWEHNIVVYSIQLLLLLHVMLCPSAGSEEREKSMLIERMVASHGQGYSERERAEFKVHVYRSVFVGIQELIKAMEALQIPYENPENYEVHCTCQVLIDYNAAIRNPSCLMGQTHQ